MQTFLIIHLSLAVPNQRGLFQHFLGTNGDLRFLQHMLQNFVSSREIPKIILLTSNAPCDEPIRLCVENIKNTFPLSLVCHIVEEGKEWSFEMKNIRRSAEAPQRVKVTFGAYHLEYFMRLKELYGFDQAVLLMAESSLFLSGEYLDAMIRESKSQLSCFLCKGLEPLIVAPHKEVADKINEVKSEKTQEFLYLKNLLSKKNPSPLKIEFFQKELGRSLYFGDIVRKARISPLPLKQGLNSFFPVFTDEDCALASQMINLMEVFKDITSYPPLQWKERISEEISSLKENCQKRENTPLKNVIHFIMDLSALDSGNTNKPEIDSNVLSHFNPPPRILTIKIKTEDLNSGYISEILIKAKEMQILSRMISLRDMPSDFEMLTKKIQDGLNGLVLRVSLSDWNERMDQQLEKFLYYKKNNLQGQDFLLYLEIEESDFQKDLKIKEIFDRYLYILDGIVLLPPLRKTGMNLDLSDPEWCGKRCEWSRNTLVLNGKNEIVLCEEVSSPAKIFSAENWKGIMDSQGHKESCKDCSRKERFNGMDEGEMPLPLFLKNNPRGLDFTGDMKENILLRLQFFYKSGQKDFFLESLKTLQSLELDMKEILFHPDFQILIQKMIREKAYDEALEMITLQLSYNPMSREALTALDFLENSALS